MLIFFSFKNEKQILITRNISVYIYIYIYIHYLKDTVDKQLIKISFIS